MPGNLLLTRSTGILWFRSRVGLYVGRLGGQETVEKYTCTSEHLLSTLAWFQEETLMDRLMWILLGALNSFDQ